MTKIVHIVGSFILVSILSGCVSQNAVETEKATVTLLSPSGKSISVQVEIADSAKEHQQGLMGRTHLPDENGMLFIFSRPAILSFWMKNTLIPLDILFFDSDGQFVSSASMKPCIQEPCSRFLSKGEAKYALEVPEGFAWQYGIEKGWALSKDMLP